MAHTVLEAMGVSKRFGGLTALAPCSISVDRGSVVGLLGPNGAGKSTLLNVIAGLLRPSSGSVLLDDKGITGMRAEDLARIGLVKAFQLPRPFGTLSVIDNMLVPAYGLRSRSVCRSLFRRHGIYEDERRCLESAADTLELLGLSELMLSPASTLSGGQLKLLDLARVMMMNPRLLLLDEPLAGVSPAMSSVIADAISKLQATGLTILLVEHRIEFVREVCDLIYVISNDGVLASGQVDECLADPGVVNCLFGGSIYEAA